MVTYDVTAPEFAAAGMRRKDSRPRGSCVCVPALPMSHMKRSSFGSSRKVMQSPEFSKEKKRNKQKRTQNLKRRWSG